MKVAVSGASSPPSSRYSGSLIFWVCECKTMESGGQHFSPLEKVNNNMWTRLQLQFRVSQDSTCFWEPRIGTSTRCSFTIELSPSSKGPSPFWEATSYLPDQFFSRLLLWKPNFHKFVIMLTKACHLTQINPFLVPTVCLCNIKFIFLQSNLELPSRIWSFRVLRPVRCAFISSPAYYMHRESHLFLYDHTNKASQYTSFATL